MIGGPIVIEWIRWNERTMDLRGSVYYLADPVTFTVAYDKVSAAMLMKDDGRMSLTFETSRSSFWMHFECDGNARDAAAELTRRMESTLASVPMRPRSFDANGSEV